MLTARSVSTLHVHANSDLSVKSIAIHLFVIATLVSLAIQRGINSDTAKRLQVTHWLWHHESEVKDGQYPGFGNVGPDGKIHAWYGIGQSLIMLPADLICTPLARRITRNESAMESTRNVLVCIITFPPLDALAIVMAFLLLHQLGFSKYQALCGALSLLFCTTFLSYLQIHMENNQTLLLVLSGIYAGVRWREERNLRWLVLAACLLGFTLLIRLPNIVLIFCSCLFVLALPGTDHTGPSLKLPSFNVIRAFALVAIPIFAVWIFLDRWYQFYRFGSFFSVYIPMSMQDVYLHPEEYPKNYPYCVPFLTGFTGPLITPSRSIFIYDPLLVVTLAVLVLKRSIISPRVRLFAITAAAALVLTLCGYARYIAWDGAAAWSHRFTTFSVNMLAMLAVPLILATFKSTTFRNATLTIMLLVATIIQAASLIFSVNLELNQRVHNVGENQFILGQRFINIGHYLAGDLLQQPSSLSGEDKKTFSNIVFLPFRISSSGGVRRMLISAWLVLLVFIAGYSFWLIRTAKRRTEDSVVFSA